MLNGTKRCPTCGEVKPAEAFGTLIRSGRTYLRSRCRPCAATARRDYYARNRELEKARHYAWTTANREHLRQYSRRRYQANPESVIQAVRAYEQRLRAERPEFYRAMRREVDRRRRLRKRGTQVAYFTRAQLIARLSMIPGCWLCGGPKQEIDHVKPLAKGGAHVLANLRPICLPCNRRKSDKWPLPSLRLFSAWVGPRLAG